jgi:hypothetical protein
MNTAISKVLSYGVSTSSSMTTITSRLYGIPIDWNNNAQGILSTPTIAAMTTVNLNENQPQIGGVFQGDHRDFASTSIGRPSWIPLQQNKSAQIGLASSGTLNGVTHESIKDIMDNSTRTSTNVLELYLGIVLNP